MISEIRIQNFKSIQDVTFRLGRVTVLIGENGSGKSNVLEAIAFAGCAAADKLDSEYLAPRGVRVTEDKWMVSAFPKFDPGSKNEPGIEFTVTGGKGDWHLKYGAVALRRNADNSFLKWGVNSSPMGDDELQKALSNDEFNAPLHNSVVLLRQLKSHAASKINSGSQGDLNVADIDSNLQKAILADFASKLGLTEFMIYSPENTTLRNLYPESTIQPLGTKGEGLIKLLQSFTDEKFKEIFQDLQSRLRLFGWFDEFLPPNAVADLTLTLQIHDRWLAPDKAIFDQRSANEGFLFVLFYFTLLMSWRTPAFFAIDNIDTALNPKLCSTLMVQIVELAKKYNKQVICTTHNPAILDGLNINDDEQRLYTVQRDADGHTVINRVKPPRPPEGKPPMKLSAAFLAGHIGGLPDHF